MGTFENIKFTLFDNLFFSSFFFWRYPHLDILAFCVLKWLVMGMIVQH
jgi:hypothetical protein